VTLTQLAVTIALLGALGLVASRFGLSAIPAYLLAGLLLGPNEPEFLTVVRPSEVTEFVAELGVIFLLFFLGLEFPLVRFLRAGRNVMIGGAIDLAANAVLGLAVGIAAFGLSFGALVLAAAVYVTSSAVTIKGLTDFRRLADEETGLVLGILLFEDLVIALVLGFAATGGGTTAGSLSTGAKAVAFVLGSLLVARWLTRIVDRALDGLPREFFLLFVFGLLIGMSATSAALGLSEAIGALMAGVVFADTAARMEIEERFFSFRDLFGALFFFVFGLTIELEAIDTVGWIVALAVALTVVGKMGGGFAAGRITGYTSRQSINVGAALVAHGEFTIVLAQVARGNPKLSGDVKRDLMAFAGLYVLATATLGVVLMKESRRIGRLLFPVRT
jgi:CPA2 family monovalent cation:H+ antiporter-2